MAFSSQVNSILKISFRVIIIVVLLAVFSLIAVKSLNLGNSSINHVLDNSTFDEAESLNGETVLGAYIISLVDKNDTEFYIEDDTNNEVLLTVKNMNKYIDSETNYYALKIKEGAIKLTASGVAGVTIIADSNSMKVSDVKKLSAIVYPQSMGQEVSWTCSDNAIASISQEGSLKAINSGKVTITATSQENTSKKGYFDVSIGNEVSGGDINIIFPGGGTDGSGGTENLDPDTGLTLLVIQVGEEKKLEVLQEPPSSQVHWNSTNPFIAYVNDSNKLIGSHVGETIIKATTPSGQSKSIKVKVIDKGSDLINIRISGNNYMKVGGETTLLAIFTPANSSEKEVSWSSSDNSIASIDENGLVKGIKKGTVSITVKSNSNPKITANHNITVVNEQIPIDRVFVIDDKGLDEGSITSDVDVQLYTKFKPDNSTENDVIWSSSNKTKLTVDSEGLCTAKIGATGSVIVTATAKYNNQIKGNYIFNIKTTVIPITEMKIVGKNSIHPNEKTVLYSFFTPSNTTETKVDWTSSDDSIITVDKTGSVEGLKSGKATITAVSKSDERISATHEMLVTKDITETTSIDVIDEKGFTSGTTDSSKEVKLFTKFNPSNATETDVTWSSSNKSKLTVDSDGNCTAKVDASGTVIVTATSTSNKNIKGSYTFSVEVARVPVKSLRVVAPSHINTGGILNNGDPFKLEAIVLPSNATNKDVIWESKNTNVATVDSFGNIVPKGTGIVTITARSVDDPSVSDSIFLTFIVPEVKPQSLYIIGGRTPLNIKDVLYLDTIIAPANTTNRNITWSVSNPEVLSVTTTGVGTAKAIAVKDGWCRVYATTSNGIVAYYDVTVNLSQADWARADDIVEALAKVIGVNGGIDDLFITGLPKGMPGVKLLFKTDHTEPSKLYHKLDNDVVYVIYEGHLSVLDEGRPVISNTNKTEPKYDFDKIVQTFFWGMSHVRRWSSQEKWFEQGGYQLIVITINKEGVDWLLGR